MRLIKNDLVNFIKIRFPTKKLLIISMVLYLIKKKKLKLYKVIEKILRSSDGQISFKTYFVNNILKKK